MKVSIFIDYWSFLNVCDAGPTPSLQGVSVVAATFPPLKLTRSLLIVLKNPTPASKCFSCGLESRLIYKQGWMCLHPRCTGFFTLHTGLATTQKLEYAEGFLELNTLPNVYLPALAPVQPFSTAGNGVATTPLFYRGWHCKSCGRLSSRYTLNVLSITEINLFVESNGNTGNALHARCVALLLTSWGTSQV